ncbi:SDR family NAD(P)-dependent oxidoreductase [Bradyrhizobium manausense]|uniref:SDR family NAD(P)-dependent oxidoreductase n=1 Tax=Bradyrhizobium TaxID=374 RepID=UPI001BA90E50|nr:MULTISPECIES: SDR family NAD(P)-dependent oxidoreductase [Bradyrhizobium]MBR0828112.1 SDR family NAD(P)-dependent oxidoreductase [Bradyrhizobium manausense]UVO33320.1 SDR family NAD(P)-dependent oxidoreductase [Bradyrhizobium arachidis]
MSGKIWFITGASRGFGRIWAEAALKRGDKVAATARIAADVADLADSYGDAVLPMALDVTNAQAVQSAVGRAHLHFGRLDVVLNNAGYALVGAIEEASEADVRAEFDTNFFGSLRVIQAALPLLRRQRSGHIIGVSSVAGVVAGPITGFYNASKFALEALHESLAQEVKSFGIKVTLLEPGAYATGFASMASLRISPVIEAYSNTRAEVFAAGAKLAFGDPQATADVILKIVDAKNPPLRFFVGTEGLPHARAVYAERLATWEAWELLSNAAQGEARPHNIAS